ncbi:Zn-dependent hydrolase [Mesorhizobium abyssinicae]|uniref:Zn-dependent hydrolase n=1 Tax=Mesorhizobium abyssinicae TaxID=1209958 RepID=A0ABU5AX50_9HYPH|nr:Zn-dependent hydrolase [Mesorhizobium abyssinicae]MDX8541887.1 Zn-dependent hydrolase [Mesorhizobium abyssinicae]
MTIELALNKVLLENYNKALDLEGFSGERLANRLAAIARIGLTTDGGSCRLGYSREERQAKDLVCEWMCEVGLLVRTDAAGNCFGRLGGMKDDLPLILCGSHIDTVPNGGHFDGVLGVLLALEAVEMWKTTGFRPQRPYEIVIFSEEEGSRFNVGFVGSSAMTGALPDDGFAKLTDQEGRTFASAVEQAGLSLDRFPAARRDCSEIAAFVEVHIEQGPILENQGIPVGIVNGICGLVGLEMVVKGLAGHAGSTPMPCRRDALVAASRMVTAIAELPPLFSATAVATVGQLNVFPNGANVIPGEVRFSVDIRDIHAEALEKLAAQIVEVANQIALDCAVAFSWNQTLFLRPVPVSDELRTWQATAMRGLNLAPFELPSGAGHDAMLLGPHMPMAMFFVRSKGGISHNPLEFSSLNDCAVAARALSRFLKLVSASTSPI